MKKAAIYARVSTPDQHVETQLYDLRKLAAQRGFEISREYCDRGISGGKARRPGLDAMMADARRGEEIFLSEAPKLTPTATIDVTAVWGVVARSMECCYFIR
jgi:DNA invertase Pin-like site-specific DNA recombinase